MSLKRVLAFWPLCLILAFNSCDDNTDGPSGGGTGTSAAQADQITPAIAQSGANLLRTAQQYVGVLTSNLGPATDYGNLGSAYAVSQIINATYGTNLTTTSTNQLYDWLRSGYGTPVDPNTPGAVIISPSVEGYAGDVGVVGQNGVVYGNNSGTGAWEPNNTVSGWQNSFDGTSGTFAFLVNPGISPSSIAASEQSDTSGPVGGIAVLGSPDIVNSSIAKIDTDGDPTEQGYDATWQAQTSGGYNAAQTPFVVVTKAQMLNQGVSMGDWALVTNNATGQQTYARVGDSGPAGGSGEISEAAATAVGIQYTKSSATIGNPSVTVQIYPGTRNIQSM